jgi:hypothetical protein
MFVPVGSVPKKRPRKLTQPTQPKKKRRCHDRKDAYHIWWIEGVFRCKITTKHSIANNSNVLLPLCMYIANH